MVNRICISINNRCNLNCKYCHFHEKSDHIISSDMNVYSILDNVKTHIEKYDIPLFKIGFVGNGEPLLDYPKLKEYIVYIGDYLKNGVISAYTITNGLLFDEDILHFFREYNVNVGFSIDGIKEIHDKWRCNSFDTVLEKIDKKQVAIVYFDIDLDMFEPVRKADLAYSEASKFPGIDYDISFNVSPEMRFEKMEDAWKRENFETLKNVTVIDVYEAENVRSITLRYSFGLMDRNLTSEEVQASMDKIVANLSEIGVTARM